MYAGHYVRAFACYALGCLCKDDSLFHPSTKLKNVMYLTGQHNIVPEISLVSDVTHVALAFMRAEIFNQVQQPTTWPLFSSVEVTRSKFANGTAIMVAIGGWGDTAGFSEAAKSDESRGLFARNVKAMVDETGADGVDVDWEYPGGNGEDYKTIPNSAKHWEIAAYSKLLSSIREALGPDKLISAAVPGLPRDMLAFTKETVPELNKYIDFYNVMTYDLMNRRDNATKHHTGVKLSLEAVDAYMERGVPPEKINLGFAFYVKWFNTDPDGGCEVHPLGCRTQLLEDPDTGADLGRAGAFSWHDTVPSELSKSFNRALKKGVYDEGGGHYFWDGEEDIWWTWDTPHAIRRKYSAVVKSKKLGGVFAWGLGEDAEAFTHLKALSEGLNDLSTTDDTDIADTWERQEL